MYTAKHLINKGKVKIENNNKTPFFVLYNNIILL